jgi:hypothetical protein
VTCAGGLSAPTARYIVHAPSLPGRNCFCGWGTRDFPGSKGMRFRHGGETPAVIRPARRCRRTPITCRPDPPPGPGSRHDPGEESKDEVGIGKGGLEERSVKRTNRIQGSRPRRASLYLFLPLFFREAISTLRHSTTIRDLPNLLPPLPLLFFPPPRSALINCIFSSYIKTDK